MDKAEKAVQKSYFDVLGLCCSSEVPLIENILKPLEGIKEVSVIVPSRTVIVVHDTLVISQLQIVKALNQARLEANIRVYGDEKHQKRWPSPYSIASGAVAVGAYPIILKAIVSIRNLRLDINILMLIAVIGTIVMNDYLEAGTIVFLFSIAEWLESRASHKANAVMSSLMNITPQKAVIAETGEVVDADEVKIDTVLAVKAGEVIPIDGVVLDGTCEVDEKTLTGESFPVAKQKDSTVWAGTINLNGYISVKTTALAEDCVVAKMAKLVEEAQNSKTSIQRLIDKFAKFYTPGVVIISALVAVIPLALKQHNEKHWLHFALVVLVSACPCALILSTPVATFCAYSKAATSGLLIKGGDHLETLAKIKVMAFDKTGTITKGEFVVTHFQSLSDDIDLNTLAYWVSSIESKSSHPLAAAIVDYGRSLSVEPEPEKVTEFENFPGEGICGKIEGRVIYIGNKKIATRAGSETVPILQGEIERGKTTGYIYLGATPLGFFSLSDTCRLGVQEAIGQLKSLGIKTAMLTGDSQSAAMQAQEQLGHSLELVHAELLPEDKVKIISEFKKEGPTAMIGDGLNDAPALAAADIGISMGISGSALASETGNIILMSNDIRKIPEAIKLARKARRKVLENIVLSIMTKAAILGLAIGGHPLVWAAVVADVGTCLLVIFNSMLLLRKGHNHGGKCCRSSTKPHNHKNGCGGSHGSSSHHHHHHEHDQQHQHEHHSHKHCCSDKTKKMSQPQKCGGAHGSSSHHHHHQHQHEQHNHDQHDQHEHHNHDQLDQREHHGHSQHDQHHQKCASQTCSSTCPPCSSNSSFGGIVSHCNTMKAHDQCKGSDEFHEHDHCHHGRCDKNHDGVHKHDTEDNHAVAEKRHGSCLGHKNHGTKHCHNQNLDKVTHDSASHSSPCHLNLPCKKESQQFTHNHCHLIHGCENLKDHESKDVLRSNHDIQHEKSGCHSDFEKHETGEISIDIITEYVELASSLEEKGKGSCREDCSDTCGNLAAVCGCESSNEREDIACCRNEDSSKECKESPIMHVCDGLNKREVGGCCKSYMKECCAKLGHSSRPRFVGGLSEIITE
ncbi:Cadmium/zinc-transporting ATPase HMA2 isoform D [Glycine soja]|uniref:Cadmium/zinc-transporting ATPase HMA2 isoform D n=1 Tax=Glycine soja TaxID=3848 RepID=A0A445HDN4_GLYSO|nr:Cadmium/zinc-transporting ATPase HMA2 isoform D [Glycine soja]